MGHKWVLKRDLPGCKAGKLSENDECGTYFNGDIDLIQRYYFQEHLIQFYPDWFEKAPNRYRARQGETYFFINSSGKVDADIERNYLADMDRYKSGNYYRTKEIAEEVVRRIDEVRGKHHEEIGE